MIICEKLRAICQKMKEYRNNPEDIDLPRARDFGIFIWFRKICKGGF